MGSSPADSATASAASSAQEANNAQLAANATAAQTAANNSYNSLFGTYNPTTGTYSGGSESQFLNPALLNQTSLNGTFLNSYNTQANANAQNAQNSVGSVLQNMNSRGMGKTPDGYDATLALDAYQNQATTNGQAYQNALSGQNAQAEANYGAATQSLQNAAAGEQSAANADLSTASGSNDSLYGTAEQQVASPWATAAGAIGGVAGGVGSIVGANGSSGKGCWVAAELFDGWDDPRTIIVRSYLFGPFAETFLGKHICALYLKFGERLAEGIRKHPVLRAVFLPIFNLALRQARKWKESR
jgi:hypothetical protein